MSSNHTQAPIQVCYIPFLTQLVTHTYTCTRITHSNCCVIECAYQSLHSKEKPGRHVTETAENNEVKATCIYKDGTWYFTEE